jgi:hypothetical protein
MRLAEPLTLLVSLNDIVEYILELGMIIFGGRQVE